jgi:hypothetical protein
MSLSPAEAQSALKDIERTENRTAASQHARATAPYLIMWGVIWAIGYTASAAAPQLSWVWLVLIVAGIAGSVLLSLNQDRALGRGRESSLRYFTSFGVIGIFITALMSIMQPLDVRQVSAVFPLIIGVFYAFIGLWTKGWRMLPLGLALIALTTLGYFALPDYFVYWMAGVGGGGLILGGLWLRAA